MCKTFTLVSTFVNQKNMEKKKILEKCFLAIVHPDKYITDDNRMEIE